MKTLKKAEEILLGIALFDLVIVAASIDGSSYATCLAALIPGIIAGIGARVCSNIRMSMIRKSIMRTHRRYESQFHVIENWRNAERSAA